MAHNDIVKEQDTSRDEPASVDEKGNREEGALDTESSDNEQQVKEFKEGGYGWYVLITARRSLTIRRWSILTGGSQGLLSSLFSSSTCTPGA